MRTLLALICLILSSTVCMSAEKPNIVLIYADDLGYGDVSCYGATGVKTPNIDRLAREGLRFTDAHSPSATCTPSRYAMLTGEYAWRKKGTGVLPGNAPLIIESGRSTLASMLQKAGYKTGVVGKWHLGLGHTNMDWNGDIKPGPQEIGFNYSFIIPATGDRVPCVYVENYRVLGLESSDPVAVSYASAVGAEPTGKEHPELLKLHPSHGHDETIVNGISRIGFMSGGKQARWVDEDMADVITGKAVSFLQQHSRERFFLYFATHDIHVPRVPHPRFVAKTTMGPRGDVIVELDWCVGEILAALDRFNLASKTMVIFTSDNGPVIDDGYKDGAVEKLGEHKPAGPFRGGKYSAFEGGTRVPMIIRWPGKIKHGVTDALVCQTDFFASLAKLTAQILAEKDAPDSFDVLSALLGQSQMGRDQLVEHARVLALRRGPWKYIEPGKGPPKLANTNTETGLAPEGLLFNLADDISERNNLIHTNRDKAQELTAELNRIRETGRSR
jgi:arylsulfatase A-like enzyme